ncbi:MAG: mitofilin family membrane protein [Aquisalinus sp.]|nr:mitofilin family membrane protein [Aquisalinus sp.]
MSSSDTPKNDEDQHADNKPEEVEAEIVETEVTETDEDVTRLEAETVTESTEAKQSDEVEADDDDKAPQSFVTTGVIMLGVMALALIVFFLTQGGEDSSSSQRAAIEPSEELLSTPDAPQETAVANLDVADDVVNNLTEDTADIAAVTEEATTEVTDVIADVAVKADETTSDIIEQTGDSLESAAETAERIVENTAEAADNVVSDLKDDVIAVVESVAEKSEEAEDNRQAAIERNRARREARAARNQAVTESDPEVVPSDGDVQARLAVEQSQTEESVASEPVTEVVAATTSEGGKIANGIAEDVKAQASENETIVSEAQLADKLESIREDVLAETQAAMAADKQRIAEQDNEIDRLRQEVDQALAEQERRAQQLEARLDTLQTRDVATATKQAALSIAVTNLQRQIGSGRPFAEQLGVLEQLAPTTPGLRDLAPYAEEGLPTLTGLRLRYADEARKALAAANRESASGFWGEIGARFSGLFSVRKTGLVSGDSPSAIISRAEVSLDDGDVVGALRELDALEGEAADTMAGWMEDARSLVSADTLLDEVSNRVLETL